MAIWPSAVQGAVTVHLKKCQKGTCSSVEPVGGHQKCPCLCEKENALNLFPQKLRWHLAPDRNIFKVVCYASDMFTLQLTARFKGTRYSVGDDKSAVAQSKPKKRQRRGRSLLLTKWINVLWKANKQRAGSRAKDRCVKNNRSSH